MHSEARLLYVSWPDGLDKHTARRADAVANAIMDALGDADLAGLVVEVTLDPGTPLAQGNYTPHIRIRERKDLGMKREADRMIALHFPSLNSELSGGKFFPSVTAEPQVGKLLPPEGL